MRFTVNVVDIDNDPQLRLRYNEAVPVLAIGDQEICRHFFDLDALTKALTTANGVS